MSNTIGEIFRLTTFGESHGSAIGGIIDGCPPGILLDLFKIQTELNRRRPGQSNFVTPRKEPDKIDFLSGIFNGKTTGASIGFQIKNTNQKSEDYTHISDAFRPSHADYVYTKKYEVRDYRGGGRSSARETANWIVAGAIAKQIIPEIKIQAYTSSIGDLTLNKPYQDLDLQLVENTPLRCPDIEMANKMADKIQAIRKDGDTIGGTATCVIKNAPIGLGEPIFDKLHARLAQAMMSINAAKGFEYGSGFEGTKMRGSQHNDLFLADGQTKSNHSGGIQGGISNGMDIYFKVAFKPVSTLMLKQPTLNTKGEIVQIQGRGRHDPCVVPRAIPILEALSAMVLADFWLLYKAKSSQNILK